MDKNNDLEYLAELSVQKQKIYGFVTHPEYTPMTAKEIMLFLQVPNRDGEIFQHLLNQLFDSGKLVLTKKNKIVTPSTVELCTGVFLATSQSFGFFRPDAAEFEKNRLLRQRHMLSEGSDIFVPAGFEKEALHRDKVLCRIYPEKSGERLEAEVVRIIARWQELIVGIYKEIAGKKGKVSGLCYPDNPKLPELFIPQSRAAGAASGHKVACRLIEFNKTAPDELKRAEVVEILGHVNDPGVDILSIVCEKGIPTVFPQEALTEAEAAGPVAESEIRKRLDLRNDLLITIDNEDAKDLDDAVSLIILPNGDYELGVHIADVSHYVSEFSALDKEAFKRGTSVYLANSVIPMLPHKLSNGICSLNENEDRLALSCIMQINSRGETVSHRISETVIRSSHRMDYVTVTEIVNDMESPFRTQYRDVCPMLDNMKTLAAVLKDKRIRRGSLEFDFPECKIKLDENGRAKAIVLSERNTATSMIEEFMLAANETVAEEYFWLNLPFCYRSHQEPDGEKLEELTAFVSGMGYRLKNGVHSKSIQALLESVKERPEAQLISRTVLRSMKQARYTPENEGHFGLAAKYYCHFTSPIRRYPDLQIHRIIKMNIHGGLSEQRSDNLKTLMPERCVHCSITERRADETERDVNAMKKAEYMEGHIDEEFEGVCSGVTSFGVFVELPNTVEGLILIDSLEGFYEFDGRTMTLTEKRGAVFSIGKKVRVSVKAAYKEQGRIDFRFIEFID